MTRWMAAPVPVAGWIAAPFPLPGPLLTNAFAELRIVADGSDRERELLLHGRHPDELERPWDPATLMPSVAEELWPWLDEVAAWLNREYTWQTDRVIPGCWPAHPHLAHELAVLAALRYQARVDSTPAKLEDWHRFALPAFYDRLATRVGSPVCPPGKHTDWPGAARHRDYLSDTATTLRETAFTVDIKQPLRGTAALTRPADTPRHHLDDHPNTAGEKES